MQNKNKGFFPLPTSFLDLLFNLSMVFLALLIMILIIMKVEIVKTKIDAQAEFIITMTWPKGDWDMDIWIGLPNGAVVFYQQKTSDILNIERDDTGNLNDEIIINGETVVNSLNQEIVVVRGIYPGEYIINIHLYRTGPSEETGYFLPFDGILPVAPETNNATLVVPLNVTVKIDKINPVLKTLYAVTVPITQNRQEHHVVRFWMNDGGIISDMSNDNPVSLHKITGLSVAILNAAGTFDALGGPNYTDAYPGTGEDGP